MLTTNKHKQACGRTPFTFFCILAFTAWLFFVGVFSLQYDSLHHCCYAINNKNNDNSNNNNNDDNNNNDNNNNNNGGGYFDFSTAACRDTLQPTAQALVLSCAAHLVVLLYVNFYERRCVYAGIHVARSYRWVQRRRVTLVLLLGEV